MLYADFPKSTDPRAPSQKCLKIPGTPCNTILQILLLMKPHKHQLFKNECIFIFLFHFLIYCPFKVQRKNPATNIAREPAVCSMMLLKPKGLESWSKAERYAEFKNKVLQKSDGTEFGNMRTNIPGMTPF